VEGSPGEYYVTVRYTNEVEMTDKDGNVTRKKFIYDANIHFVGGNVTSVVVDQREAN